MRLPAQLLTPEASPLEEIPVTSWSAPSALRLAGAGEALEPIAVASAEGQLPVARVSTAADSDRVVIATALHAAGFTKSAMILARQASDGKVAEWDAIARADAELARVIEAHGTAGVPSVQVRDDGTPRFIATSMDAEGLLAAFRVEHGGDGVDSELRLFLDEALSAGDRYVDFAPNFGFAALTAATADAGDVLACVETADDAAALRASARLTGCETRLLVRTTDGPDAWTLPHTDGLVLLHAGAAANVAPLMQALRSADCAVRLDAVAWRCGATSDADYDAESMHVAAAVLSVLGFQHFALAVGASGVELVPADAAASNTMIFSLSKAFLARGGA
jgi:hypothetical protein